MDCARKPYFDSSRGVTALTSPIPRGTVLTSIPAHTAPPGHQVWVISSLFLFLMQRVSQVHVILESLRTELKPQDNYCTLEGEGRLSEDMRTGTVG